MINTIKIEKKLGRMHSSLYIIMSKGNVLKRSWLEQIYGKRFLSEIIIMRNIILLGMISKFINA